MSNDFSAASVSLADRLLAATPAIVARSLEYMPRDEFWELRYAERARRFANEDGAFHVRYLSDAVRASSPTIMIEYARWLRDLLVPRGMCTLHLAEHLEHIGRAVEAEPDAERASNYVSGAIIALQYGDGPGAAVQGVAEDLDRTDPGLSRGAAARNSAWRTRYLIHYIADALQRDQPELLAKHVAWSRELWISQGGDAAAFDRWLASIDAALAPFDVRKEFRTCRSDT